VVYITEVELVKAHCVCRQNLHNFVSTWVVKFYIGHLSHTSKNHQTL